MRTNLNPALWGRDGWAFLKSCAEACDEESLPHYKALVELLPHVLPCEKCRRHAREYIAQHPVQDAASMGRWVRDFEQAVRERVSGERQQQQQQQQPRRAGPSSPGEALAYLGVGALLSLLLLCALSMLRCTRAARATRAATAAASA